jgi:Porin subfamily
MKKFAIVVATGLACLTAGLARAGEPASQNSMFLPPGKSPAMQALEAKKNTRCMVLYGPGYMALGDSDTCIRIGGRVGVEVGGSTKQNRLIIPSGGLGAPAPTLGGKAPAVPHAAAVVKGSSTGTVAGAEVYVDTRTQTDMGELGTRLTVRGMHATGDGRGPDYIH